MHRPLTLLWPTDAAFRALPESRQKFLYRREHRDVLASYLKAHIIRDTKVNGTAHGLAAARATRGATACCGCVRVTLLNTLLPQSTQCIPCLGKTQSCLST